MQKRNEFMEWIHSLSPHEIDVWNRLPGRLSAELQGMDPDQRSMFFSVALKLTPYYEAEYRPRSKLAQKVMLEERRRASLEKLKVDAEASREWLRLLSESDAKKGSENISI
jgi:hypothetical protein